MGVGGFTVVVVEVIGVVVDVIVDEVVVIVDDD